MPDLPGIIRELEPTPEKNDENARSGRLGGRQTP